MQCLKRCRATPRWSFARRLCRQSSYSLRILPFRNYATPTLRGRYCLSSLCRTRRDPRKFYSVSSAGSDETIYALSTAPGRAAIAVIRVSGPACLSIYKQLCPGKILPKPRAATLRHLKSPLDHDETLDAGALILYFPGPKTVTGEDVLELHVHGGPAIVRRVLEAIPQCAESENTSGAVRPAEAGEFTKRAFYNGRIDLTAVEALGETLAAETEQQRRLAVSGSASALTQRYEEWRSMLLYARGELEALIDFSEDQHFDESPAELMGGTAKQVLALKQQLDYHVLNASRGELLRSGIAVALLGAPNAGKSSLLNHVVGREAAIVSAEEGTTRDIVDVSIDIQGWLVRLGDMAGVRTGLAPTLNLAAASTVTSDRLSSVVGAIEQEGIRRAKERALQSDLVIVLVSLEPNADGEVELALNEELLDAVQQCYTVGKQMLFVVNKIDLLHQQRSREKITLSRLLSTLLETFPQTAMNDVFCLSCKEAEIPDPDQLDAGGLQTFIAGLTKKFGSMTSAAAGLDDSRSVEMSPAEAQSYWTASLSVTHRQSQYLQECIVHLQNFLEISSPGNLAAEGQQNPSLDAEKIRHRPGAARGQGFFDTLDEATSSAQPDARYHVDNHDDLVGEVDPAGVPTEPQSIPYSWAIPTSPDNINDEVDIVTAAEHLRSAADCLAKLTGRGDGVSSGADVEDVLGVVFEKFCVGK